MAGRSRRAVLLTIALSCSPLVAFAQGSIVGVVRDTSGAVLPGVTVEASSPVLIEKVRTTTTDGSGQYRIVDLRPGAYTVTFSLTGFSTVKREGVELTGSFNATINTDMTVGGLEQTVTVSAATPIVDVQSATRERVMSADLVATLPTGRNFSSLGVLVPGVTQQGGQDVGGTMGTVYVDLVSHGSHADGERLLHNGVSVMALYGSGTRNSYVPNPIAYEELSIASGATGIEQGQGGVRLNFIPRNGGNEFHVTSFMSFSSEGMQGDNFTQDLKSRGLTSPPKIYRNTDINPGVGGPIVRDKIWFFAATRYNSVKNYVPGMFYNQNLNKPAAYLYVPDRSRPAISELTIADGLGRVTWQATQKNKFSFAYDHQSNDPYPIATPTGAPEVGSTTGKWSPERITTVEWSAPLTNRLLVEAVLVHQYELGRDSCLGLDLVGGLHNVLEQGGIIPGLSYRAPGACQRNETGGPNYRAGVSYVSGAHAVKIGFNDGFGYRNVYNYLKDLLPYSIRLLNGTPNLLTLRSAPAGLSLLEGNQNRLDHEGGIYAQDKWTYKRVTLDIGVRYDFYSNHFPEQKIGPSPLAPTRNITFPEQDNLSWKDISPRLNTVWDLFGSGKTAIKASLNRYVAGVGLGAIATDRNPALGIITSTTRSWTDNGNFVPDCDLLNPGAQDNRAAGGDLCGAMANANFGKATIGTSFDPELLRGWNKRGFDWEFGLGVQHEILPRVAVDVAYYRRWFGNFLTIDNRAVPASGYDRFDITAPVNAKLPDGGGYKVTGLYDLNPAYFGIPSDLYQTLASNYGDQVENWNGMDFNVNARLPRGAVLSGGFSTGKTVTDNCDVAAKTPELLSFIPPGAAFNALASFRPGAWMPASFCHMETPFLTQAKLLGSYTVPKIDVRVSATFQSNPGPQITSTFNVTNAMVQAALGRGIAGGGANIPTNIVMPGTLYGDRLNQLDLRFAKLLSFGRSRSSISLDVFNALNTDAVLTENANYTALRVPTSVIMARFAKVSWQFDF